MSESNSDKLSRLTIMSTGSETWDLSPNDQRAIRFALDEIDRLTRERDSERDLVTGLVNRISEIYQIADGPNRDVDGNEVESVRELRRERDEARGGIRDAYNWLKSWNPDAARGMLTSYPWIIDEPTNQARSAP